MTSLLDFLPGLVSVVAVVAGLLSMMLVLRNPLSPRWLRSELAAQGLSIAFVALFSFAVGRALTDMITMNVPLLFASLVTLGVLFVSGTLFWSAFRIGERLRRADAGHSPFERLGHGADWSGTHGTVGGAA